MYGLLRRHRDATLDRLQAKCQVLGGGALGFYSLS